MRSSARCALALATMLAVSNACAYGHRITFRFLDGPMDAIALAHVAPDRLLVLAGTERLGKSVSVFYDSVHSVEILRFPVSRYATGIRGGSDGTFVLAIATNDAPENAGSGAIEMWNVRGQHLRSIVFPGPLVAITKPSAGVVYALVGVAGHRGIVGTRMADGAVVSHTPVDTNVVSIDRCTIARETYLLTSSPKTHAVRLINARSGFAITTPLIADRPRCTIDGASIVGLRASTFGSEVSVLHLSATNQRIDTMVASPDAVEVESSEGRLFLLRRSGDSSQIDIWLRSDLAAAGLAS